MDRGQAHTYFFPLEAKHLAQPTAQNCNLNLSNDVAVVITDWIGQTEIHFKMVKISVCL